ncbi:hypothetical protein J7E88_17840 [Streptomyces sp. ISL-10]|uniref:hypothetical protein n=1 Tax=Streptomyces sp. ISL-10 TaxID=2819172 RepID=UPI001BE915B2|nr:hypothetical protein [Streptomyces sp. ISL-10]MBT2367118.1 hypothetical protein [Streptomyces sp. ISL-10]
MALRKGIALVPREERAAVLMSVAEPLRDMLSVEGLLAPETAAGVREATEECLRTATV